MEDLASPQENFDIQAELARITHLMSEVGTRLQSIKESAKKKFGQYLEDAGLTRTAANKLMKVSRAAEELGKETAGILGIDILAQLSLPRFADVREDFVEHPPENQLEAADRIKEWKRSQPKKQKPELEFSHWGDAVRMNVNGSRIARIPDLYDQDAISALIRQMEKEGKAAQTITSEALLFREEIKAGLFVRVSEHVAAKPVESGEAHSSFVVGSRILYKDAYRVVIKEADEDGDVVIVDESGIHEIVNKRLLEKVPLVA